MNFLKTILSVAVMVIAAPLWAGSVITFDMKHTVQNCDHDGHQKTWCLLSDKDLSNEQSGLEAHINSLLDRALKNPSKARVFAAEFSFSNKGIQEKMCELGRAGVAISVYIDRGSSGDIAFVKDCQQSPTHHNFRANTLGGFADFPKWRLHHNKTVIIDAGDGSNYDIAYSSGNLSKFGTSLHMDNWVFAKASSSSNLARASLCLFESLDAAEKVDGAGGDWSKDPQIMQTYQSSRDKCYTANKVIPMDKVEEAIAQEGIAPFFTPNKGSLARRTLEREILKVIPQSKQKPAYIYIAIQHFNAADIAQALNDAGGANPGVDVRLIMSAGTVTGASEVEGDEAFYKDWLKNNRIKVRFIEINSNTGQQMHNKFAILNGKRIFSGAGHYTGGGLQNNFETLYLVQDVDLTKKYAQYFKDLWDVSVDESYLTEGTPNTMPAPLNSEFLKLLEQ